MRFWILSFVVSAHSHIEKRLNESAMNATINRELACLSRMANLAIEKELIHRFPRIKLLKEIDKQGRSNRRTGFFEHDQFLAFRGALGVLNRKQYGRHRTAAYRWQLSNKVDEMIRISGLFKNRSSLTQNIHQ